MQLIRLGKADLPGIEREVGRKKWIEYCCLKNEALFEEISKALLSTEHLRDQSHRSSWT